MTSWMDICRCMYVAGKSKAGSEFSGGMLIHPGLGYGLRKEMLNERETISRNAGVSGNIDGGEVGF